MDVLDMARDLGRSIAESRQMQNLKECDARLQSDDKALLLMKEYKELQVELVQASKSLKEKEIIDSAKEMLLKKQRELYDYEITNDYLEAKAAFDIYMKKINDVISFSINGEQQCSQEGCGGCKGCG